MNAAEEPEKAKSGANPRHGIGVESKDGQMALTHVSLSQDYLSTFVALHKSWSVLRSWQPRLF